MAMQQCNAPITEVASALTSGDSTRIQEILIRTAEVPWRAKSLAGVFEKRLWTDETTGASISMNKYLAGHGIPAPHSHASNQFMFCLQGRYEYTSTGVVLTPGCFYCNPKGNIHGPTIAHEESILLEFYDGPHYPRRPDWYTEDDDAR